MKTRAHRMRRTTCASKRALEKPDLVFQVLKDISAKIIAQRKELSSANGIGVTASCFKTLQTINSLVKSPPNCHPERPLVILSGAQAKRRIPVFSEFYKYRDASRS